MLAAFLGWAVAETLRHLFAQPAVRADDILGPLCGYLLASGVWANLYVLTALLVPGAFKIDPAIAGNLAEWHGRRALFEYFNLVTLPSMGSNAITPVGPPATTLVVLEARFGQFYIAVVVAQLVGIRLAQALRPGGPEPK